MRRTLLAALLSALALGGSPALAAVDPGTGQVYETARVVVPMTFPVAGPVSYSDNWLVCRSGCTRMHMGQDLMGRKLQPLLAAFDGVVSSVRRESGAGGGNHMVISADRGPAKGWSAVYVHVNNDSPGTDDGKGTAAWSFPAGIEPGARVLAGQLVGWLGDSGNAESTAPHLHVELRKGEGWGGVPYNAFPSLQAARRLSAPLPSGPHPVGSLLRHPTGALFVLDDAGKRPASPAVLAQQGRSTATAVPMTAAESLGYPTGRPLVDRDVPELVGAEGSPQVLLVDSDGTLRPVPHPAVLASHGLSAGAARVVQAQELVGRATGAPLGLRDGTLVQTPSHRVGVVSGGALRRIWDSRQVAAYGYSGRPRLPVPDSLLAGLTTTALTAR